MGCGTNIVPGFNESNKIKDPALETHIGYELSKSGDTQVPNTIATYRKVMNKHFKGVDGSDILDYGAGLGLGTQEFGLDSFEPYAKRGFQPDYTDSSQITKKYKGIISNAVLNVLPRKQRIEAVKTIGDRLKVGGTAVIMARDTGLYKSLKNPKPHEDGVITQKGTFQKGFSHKELLNFIRSVLGNNFSISMDKSVGDNGIVIIKMRESDTSGRIKALGYLTRTSVDVSRALSETEKLANKLREVNKRQPR